MSAAVREQTGAGERSDEDLVACVRRGEDRAFERLYERYQGRIVAYVFSMVRDHGRAEDVTQEIFLSALRRMRQTERPIAFRPWIYEIARNACIDQFRRSGRVQECSYDAGAEVDDPRLASAAPGPDSAVHAKEELSQLCGALGGLSASHHQILVLRELEGLSYREIGERMSMSRPAVESTLFRARRRLSHEYDELISGRRCERVQGLLSTAAAGAVSGRESRRLARHLSYCQPCRRHAHDLGMSDLLPARQGLGGRVAALLPLPAFLRRGRSGGAPSEGAGLVGQWSSSLAPLAEPLASSWSKAAAALVAVTVAGVGGGMAGHGPLAASLGKPAAGSVPSSVAEAAGRRSAAGLASARAVGSAAAAAAGQRAGKGGSADQAAGIHGARPQTPGSAGGQAPAAGAVTPSAAWQEITARPDEEAVTALPTPPPSGMPTAVVERPIELQPPAPPAPPAAGVPEAGTPSAPTVSEGDAPLAPETDSPSVAAERPSIADGLGSGSQRRGRSRRH